MFNGLPTVPVQPTTPNYGVEALALFPTFRDRNGFRLATGLIAPPFDRTQKARNWCDFSPNPGYPTPGTYLEIGGGQGAAAALMQVPVPKNVGLPNFASAFTYAPWNNSAETAATDGTSNPVSPINAELLCTLADAQLLATLISAGLGVAAAVTENTDLEASGAVEWNGETRRIYSLVINGIGYNAGLLANAVFANGVDPVYGPPPGTFVIQGGQRIAWTKTPDPVWAEVPVLGVPCRSLMPGEQFGAAAGGMGTQVVNTKLPQGGGAQSGGGFTDADRSLLTAIAGKLGIAG